MTLTPFRRKELAAFVQDLAQCDLSAVSATPADVPRLRDDLALLLRENEARDSLQARPVGGVEDERAAFEAWVASRDEWRGVYSTRRDRQDRYTVGVSLMWDAWQAARRATPPHVEPVSGGEDEVPHPTFDLLAEAKRLRDWLPGGDAECSRWVGDAAQLIDVLIARGTHPAPVCDRVAGEGEIEALRNDAERIDWLEAQFANGVHVEGCFTGNWDQATLARAATVFFGSKEARGKTIREAIDAAIASTLAPAALNGGEKEHG